MDTTKHPRESLCTLQLITAWCSMVMLFFAGRIVHAQDCYQPVQTITHQAVGVRDVVVHNDRAFISLPKSNALGDTRGFIYERSKGTWVQRAAITPPFSVLDESSQSALDGDVLARTGSIERVYIFRRASTSSWPFETELMAEHPNSFGSSLALRGDVLAVGAPSDETFQPHAGAVYIFRWDGQSWEQEEKLHYPPRIRGGRFGESVAFVGEQLVVGAPQIYQDNDSGGLVYIYSHIGSDWVLTTILTANDGMESDEFGSALSSDGNTLLVGAPGNDEDGRYSLGAVYVFDRAAPDNWSQTTKIMTPGAVNGDEIGSSIDISNDTILIGGWRDDNFGYDTGAAYTFIRSETGWTFDRKIWPPALQEQNRFGWHVAIAGEQLFISSDEPVPGIGRGRVYVFDRTKVDMTDCDGDGTPDACESFVDCNNNGVSDLCDIANGFWDCDGDLILDVCEIAAGRDDCNENLIEDWCEMVSGLVTDCNLNGVPDDCDIAEGIALDCDTDGVADFCEVDDYALPVGLLGLSYFPYVIGDSLWMNGLEVQQGAESISSLSVFVYSRQTSTPPITLLVYADPNDDGDPRDAILLSQRTFTSYVIGEWNRFEIPPAYVGSAGEVFYAAVFTAVDPLMEERFLQTLEGRPQEQSISWWGVGEYGAVDLIALTGFSALEITRIGAGDLDHLFGNWMIRADATHYEGVPTDCMCPGNISNGSVRGQNDNNEVNVHDLFALLANWGECGEPCAPFCAGDISGAHGLPDCAVDMFDLMAVLDRWGKCE